MIRNGLLLVYLLVLGTRAEDLVACRDANGTHALPAGASARVVTRDYPNAVLYRHEPCSVSFTSNAQLQITFVNGLLEDFEKVTISGLQRPPGFVETALNTVLTYGRNFSQFTYVGSTNLTVGLPQFDFHFWYGFEAVVAAVNESAKCGGNVVVDLASATGPLEFGTCFIDDSSAASDCSWLIRGAHGGGRSIKVVVKYAELSNGETLVFKGSATADIPYNSSTPVYRFPSESEVTVTYHRTSGNSPQHGAYLQTSVYNDMQYKWCNYSTADFVKILGKQNPMEELNNFVRIDLGNQTRTPYLNNQQCTWSYQIEAGYELNVFVDTIVIEPCCDILKMESSDSTQPEIIDPFGYERFVFNRDTSQYANFTWSSDGSVELEGFSLVLTAKECVCQKSEIHLSTANPVESIYSFSDFRSCNNIECHHKVFGIAGRPLRLALTLTVRSISEDSFLVTNGSSLLLNVTGGSGGQSYYNNTVISESGYMEITMKAGQVTRYNRGDPISGWSGTVRVISDTVAVTTLSASYPAAYRSSNDISKWTISTISGNHVELLALSGPTDGINYFTIYDGPDENPGASLGDFSNCLNRSAPLRSTNNTLTIVRTQNLDMGTDFVAYARDPSFHDMCGEILQLLRYTTSFNVTAPIDRDCFFLLDDSTGTLYGDHFIRFESVFFSVPSDSSNPIRILGGTEKYADYETVAVATLYANDSSRAWRYIELHNRIGTILLPKASSFSATATRERFDANNPRYVYCGDSGTLASQDYGAPNYYHKIEMHDEIPLFAGRTKIDLQVTVMLGKVASDTRCDVGGQLRISSSEWGGFDSTFSNITDFGRKISFTSTGFKVDYIPSGSGECGFLISYTFGSCYFSTTVAPPDPFDYEIFVRCNSMRLKNETVTFESDIQPIRIISRDYPYTKSNYHPECRIQFSAPGKKLKISFVNAYLISGQEVTLSGVSNASQGNLLQGNVSMKMNTGVAHFNEFTFFANESFAIGMPAFNFDAWFGFEAIVTIVNDEMNCYNYYLIPLDDFEGPFEFGTNWKNRSDQTGQPRVCSWHLKTHSGYVYAIKLNILRANLRPGESLYFVGDVHRNITYTGNQSTFVFEYQDNVYIYYERTGPDSDVYGVYFQSSNAFVRDPPSSAMCQHATDGIITLGEDVTNYTITNVVDFGNGTLMNYLNSQTCEWAFAADVGFEVHVYIRQLAIEECCDFLTMTINDTPINVYSSSSHLYILDRQETTSLNISWSSDPSISLEGFVIDVDASNCTCLNEKIVLDLSNPRQAVTSYSGYTYCSNINCITHISTIDDYVIVFDIVGRLRNSPDEYITAAQDDFGIQTLFLFNGSEVSDFAKTVVDVAGYMVIELNSGAVNQSSQIDGYWDGMLVLMHEYSAVTQFVFTSTATYKSSNDVGVWTIWALNTHFVDLLVYSKNLGDLDAFQLRDGDEHGEIVGRLSMFYNNTVPYRSKTDHITIERLDWRIDSDFTIIVKDSVAMQECAKPFVFDSNSFAVSSPGSSPCSFTMVNTIEDLSSDHFIVLSNMSIQYLGQVQSITVVAGPYADGAHNTTLVQFDASNKWNDGQLEFHERIITLVLPAGTTLSGRAFANTVTHPIVSLPLGGQSMFSSRDYGAQRNYRFNQVEHYEATCAGGTVQITFDLTVDLLRSTPGSLRLQSIPRGYIDISYPDSDGDFASGHFVFNITADGFILDYLPPAGGERGFFLIYSFADTPFVSTTTRITRQSTSKTSTTTAAPTLTTTVPSTTVPSTTITSATVSSTTVPSTAMTSTLTPSTTTSSTSLTSVSPPTLTTSSALLSSSSLTTPTEASQTSPTASSTNENRQGGGATRKGFLLGSFFMQICIVGIITATLRGSL